MGTKDKTAECNKAIIYWSRDHQKEKSVLSKVKSDLKLLSGSNCPNRKK